LNIEGFIDDLSLRTVSRHTISAYRSDLRLFERFLANIELDVDQVTPSTIEQYIRDVLKARTNGDPHAPASINRRLSVLSMYFEFRQRDGHGEMSNPMHLVRRRKVDNVMARAVEDVTITALLAGVTNLRDKALISVAVTSGLRLSDLQSLDRGTIRRQSQTLPDGRVRILGIGEVIRKGNKRRSFLVDEDTVKLLVAYLRTRGNDGIDALFKSSRKTRLSCRGIQMVLDRWCKKLNLTHSTVHQLRHTFCTRLANANIDPMVLRDLMAHESFTTTQRYFKIKPQRLAAAYFASMEA
jgi:site-specific recombinase XerD